MYKTKVTRWFHITKHNACGWGVKVKPKKGDHWHYVGKYGAPLLFDLKYDACAFAKSMVER